MCSVVKSDMGIASFDSIDHLYDEFTDKIKQKEIGKGLVYTTQGFQYDIAKMARIVSKIDFVKFPEKCLDANLTLLSALKLMLETFTKLDSEDKVKYRTIIHRIITKFSPKHVLNNELREMFEDGLKANGIDLKNYSFSIPKPRKKVKKVTKGKSKTSGVGKEAKVVQSRASRVGVSALSKWLRA